MENTASSKPFEAANTESVFNGVSLSTRTMPAHSAARGGDWCETFVLTNDVVALSIGDICGHGPEQYNAMVVARQAVRDAARLGLDPSRTLAAANNAVCSFDPQLHATALFALLDTRRGQISFANAGHPPPLIVGTGGAEFVTYAVTDLPLGIVPGLLPTLRFANTAPNSFLVLYTDGVTEHERLPIQGEADLRNAALFAFTHSAAPSAAVIEELMFLTGPNHDDASILAAWTPSAAARSRAAHPRRIRKAPHAV